MDRGGSRRGPGIVSGHLVPLEAAVNELFTDGDLGHSGEVGEPGIAASTAVAAVGFLILEAPGLRPGSLEFKLTGSELLLIGLTV